MEHPSGKDMQAAIDEVQRVNEVYWNLQHFDTWSPFLNPSIGHFGLGADLHETMKQVEEEWQIGGTAQETEKHIKSIGGDETYAKVFFISAAVGFRSHDLPEPYDGDWSSDRARYHAAPLIVSTDGGLGVQLHEGRMASLTI